LAHRFYPEYLISAAFPENRITTMTLSTDEFIAISPLADRYHRVRDASLALCRTLEPEDYVIQSMPSVSPVKWHLAHTTWFFEQFVLITIDPNHEIFNEHFHYLFNSYYLTKGQMYPRTKRGLLSRPTVAQTIAYREYIDERMRVLLKNNIDPKLHRLIELGTHHEQQHQELMLTDIKHVFSLNPTKPALVQANKSTHLESLPPLHFLTMAGGLKEIGADTGIFCFDNETPRHQVFINDFGIADRLITNREYREFIEDGAYKESSLWLSDGWTWLQADEADRPLYWSVDLDTEFTLSGQRAIDPHAPVCHVSFYEADAYARWAGYRLPTEMEWEVVAERTEIKGNFVDKGLLHPQPLIEQADNEPNQLFGDAWEWTASSYSPYPGFKPLAGSIGEYNGKFMCNQMVCRGGSCVTPADHIRSSYRNFFYPHERWQFFGIRLARHI
jgi:ergothioneine biosynthesis protein EgtB